MNQDEFLAELEKQCHAVIAAWNQWCRTEDAAEFGAKEFSAFRDELRRLAQLLNAHTEG